MPYLVTFSTKPVRLFIRLMVLCVSTEKLGPVGLNFLSIKLLFTFPCTSVTLTSAREQYKINIKKSFQ